LWLGTYRSRRPPAGGEVSPVAVASVHALLHRAPDALVISGAVAAVEFSSRLGDPERAGRLARGPGCTAAEASFSTSCWLVGVRQWRWRSSIQQQPGSLGRRGDGRRCFWPPLSVGSAAGSNPARPTWAGGGQAGLPLCDRGLRGQRELQVRGTTRNRVGDRGFWKPKAALTGKGCCRDPAPAAPADQPQQGALATALPPTSVHSQGRQLQVANSVGRGCAGAR